MTKLSHDGKMIIAGVLLISMGFFFGTAFVDRQSAPDVLSKEVEMAVHSSYVTGCMEKAEDLGQEKSWKECTAKAQAYVHEMNSIIQQKPASIKTPPAPAPRNEVLDKAIQEQNVPQYVI